MFYTFIIDEKKPMPFESVFFSFSFFFTIASTLSVFSCFQPSIFRPLLLLLFLLPPSLPPPSPSLPPSFHSLCPKIKHTYSCHTYSRLYTRAHTKKETSTLSKVSVILRKTIKTAVIYVPHCDEKLQTITTCKSLRNTRHIIFFSFRSFSPSLSPLNLNARS